MAIVSDTRSRVHADEFDHVAAARFYAKHWLPPAVADPRTLDSYSYAGMSYLNEWDVVYLLAGKFGALVEPLVHDEVRALRLFNVLLFVLLVLMALRRRDATLAFAIVLVSPQIWYLFSYFNSDAFPLFLSLLAAYELAAAAAALDESAPPRLMRYVRLGVYVGLLILSKKTFWMFAVFACVFMAIVELYRPGHALARSSLRRIAIVGAVAVAVALPRMAYDVYVNGTPAEKVERIGATAEMLADDEFKPSRRGSGPYSQGMGLKEKGVGFSEVATGVPGRSGWFWESLTSAFGVYYYFLVRGPDILYALNAACVALLFGMIALAGLRERRPGHVAVLALAAASSIAVVALSFHHSWVNDYQPQGRYLFAIVPMAALLLARTAPALNPAAIKTVIGAAFILSVASFVLVGLLQVPKFWDRVEPSSDPVLKLEREWQRRR